METEKESIPIEKVKQTHIDQLAEFMGILNTDGLEGNDPSLETIADALDQYEPVLKRKVFTAAQLATLRAIVTAVISTVDFHSYEDEMPHNQSIGKEICRLTREFKTHRHNATKQFTSVPEE